MLHYHLTEFAKDLLYNEIREVRSFPSLSANSRNSTSYGYFLIMIGTRSIVLIPYFETLEAFYEVLLATKLATLVAKIRFSTNLVLEQRKITSCSFFSFLIYTFVGVHFNGHKESMLFASALSWRCGNSPQQQIPLDLPASILLDWNTHILADSKQPSIRERVKT